MQFHFCVFLSRLSELVWKLAGEMSHQLALKRFPSLVPPANGNEINAKKSRFRANRKLMGTIYNCSAILRSFSVVSNSAKRDANRFFKVLLLSYHRLISRQDKQKSKFCACAKIGILFLWTWGAFHLLRNSENSSWDVDGTHVFRTFHWKVPGNNWIFKKGSPSCFPFGNFRWKSMFHLRVFTRNHRPFQAIHGDICATIMNIGDKSITNGACVKWNTFFTRWTFPWKFPKVFRKWKTPMDTR